MMMHVSSAVRKARIRALSCALPAAADALCNDEKVLLFNAEQINTAAVKNILV